jgi:LPXTG-motif cell wall-anchored protein
MTCEPLAYTGGGQLGLMIAIAIACLAAGGLLLLLTRRRGRVVTVALLLLV